MPAVFKFQMFLQMGIFVLLLLIVLYHSATLLIPISLAVLLSLFLAPLVHVFERWRIPAFAASLLALVLFLSGTALGLQQLAGPGQKWVDNAPENFSKANEKLKAVIRPLEHLTAAAQDLEMPSSGGPASSVQNVRVVRSAITAGFVTGTTQIISAIGVTILLALILLSSGDHHLRKLVTVLPEMSDKKRAVAIIRSAQDDISFYLLAVAGVNFVLGIGTAILTWVFGVPDPQLWAAIAFAFGFVPFAGPAIVTALLFYAGLITFNTIATAALLAASFGVFVVIANQVLLPKVLGERLSLNPVTMFLAIIFWAWMWGPIGALLAVPMLACLRSFAQRTPALAPLGEFLNK